MGEAIFWASLKTGVFILKSRYIFIDPDMTFVPSRSHASDIRLREKKKKSMHKPKMWGCKLPKLAAGCNLYYLPTRMHEKKFIFLWSNKKGVLSVKMRFSPSGSK